jgi:hypothetical protein
MSVAEVLWRVRDQGVQTAWKSPRLRPRPPGQRSRSGERRFTALLPPGTADQVPEPARKAIIETADSIMSGELEILGLMRTDLKDPDWFYDPVTGRRSDPDLYAFAINHRDESVVGNVKHVWELSRHHHLTQLAAAWYLTHESAYAERVAEHLRSWWRANPFLSGVHWTSGIELGIRLLNWTWIRRLLSDWPGASELFEDNDVAVRQLFWHQKCLATFRSKASSANNHAIAESAGLLIAACAFAWFPQSAKWRQSAQTALIRDLAANTFDSGVNRELATDYHRFTTELGTLALVEATAVGYSVPEPAWTLAAKMFDVAAAIVDESMQPPRQGDDDEGRVLVLDPPDPHSWAGFLALGAQVTGPADWWPSTASDAVSTLVGAYGGGPVTVSGRPRQRPSHFADAGLTLLRAPGDQESPEIWCRCDGGPHGFLSIAAHAHADALSIELRVGGVDVLADPGTYCYHGEPEWRDYFRSTSGHNTLRVARRDQSVSGGPFLWLRHATARPIEVSGLDGDGRAIWRAEHDGYTDLTPPAIHRRTVTLDRRERILRVADELDCAIPRDVELAFHLGPRMRAQLDGHRCELAWSTSETHRSAVMELPSELQWRAISGETEPIAGWYSPRFGRKVSSTTLLGAASIGSGTTLVTTLSLAPTTSKPR